MARMQKVHFCLQCLIVQNFTFMINEGAEGFKNFRRLFQSVYEECAFNPLWMPLNHTDYKVASLILLWARKKAFDKCLCNT